MGILEIVHTNADGTEVTASIEEAPIRHFIGVVKFKSTDIDFADAEVKNVTQYGWDGDVYSDYQTLEEGLLSKIKLRLGENRKAKCIVLFSHGSKSEYKYTINKIKRIYTSSNVCTNHQSSPKNTLSGLNFHFLNRLENELPKEREENNAWYLKEKAKIEFEIHTQETYVKVRNSTDDKDWEGRANVFRKIDTLKNELKELTAEYNSIDSDIQYQINSIRKNYCTAQSRQDMLSLKRIIDLVEDGGYLIFAACHSGHGLGGNSVATQPFLTELQKHYKTNIHIGGIEFKGSYSSANNIKGLIDGNVLLANGKGIELVSKSNASNKATIVNPAGVVSTYGSVQIVKNKLKFI